jgi:hypothetical protein
MDMVAADAEAVYGTNGRYRRLVIHELCKMATSPPSVRRSTDEISDDERYEEDEAVHDGDDAALNAATISHEHVHEHIVNDVEEEIAVEIYELEQAEEVIAGSTNGTDVPSVAASPAALRSRHRADADCEQCEREQNSKICEVAQFMIDVSHSLGPMRLLLAGVNNNEDGQRYDEDEIGGERGERFQFHESILTVPDSSGKTPLHILCEGSCDLRMMKVIFGCTRENTGNPCSPTALSLVMAKDSRGCTPLHYLAFSRQCPFSSLRLIMDFCQPVLINDLDCCVRIDPTVCCDSDGDTPLHWALDGYISPRRIRELTRHSKDAIIILNNAGKRPFDQFAANFIDPDWKVHEVCGREVWDNIQAYLRVIFEKPSHESNPTSKDKGEKAPEWLPLHLLAGSPFDFPLVFMDIALHFCHDDLSKVNASGMLPLHLACRRCTRNPDIPCDGSLAHKILAKYPPAAYKVVTTTKRLGLHLAVATQKPMSLITALIKAYPRSLNSPDPVTRLWPFVLAGVNNDVSVEVSFTLLRADPSILHLAMKDEIEKKNQRAKEMIRLMAEAEEELEDQSSRRIRRLTIRDPH